MRKTDKPHHYYKIAAESEVGEALNDFMSRCREATETARYWVEHHGADHYVESLNGMAGGVIAVEFDKCTAKPGWEKISTPDGSVFFLPEKDSELEREMYALPIVSETELIGILKFVPRKNNSGIPLPFTFGETTPMLFMHHGYWYVDVPYTCADIAVIPIEEKEFYRRRMAAQNEMN